MKKNDSFEREPDFHLHFDEVALFRQDRSIFLPPFDSFQTLILSLAVADYQKGMGQSRTRSLRYKMLLSARRYDALVLTNTDPKIRSKNAQICQLRSAVIPSLRPCTTNWKCQLRGSLHYLQIKEKIIQFDAALKNFRIFKERVWSFEVALFVWPPLYSRPISATQPFYKKHCPIFGSNTRRLVLRSLARITLGERPRECYPEKNRAKMMTITKTVDNAVRRKKITRTKKMK